MTHRAPAAMRPPAHPPRRAGRLRPGLAAHWRLGLALVLAAVVGSGAVYENVLGVGDKFDHLVRRVELAIAPPPDRTVLPDVEVTAAPGTPTPAPSLAPGATPTPTPVRAPVDVNLLADPARYFASEIRKDWCAPAGVQMVLAVLGKADTSQQFQATLAGRVGEWESYADSHNGEWGPSAMALALAAYGAPGYKVRVYPTLDAAMHDAAAALSTTHAPVILIAWRGAHTWVMTGYRADADPTLFADATVTGAYILDPWYPRVSSIWGPSDPPGTFQDASELVRNYLPWKRPEGLYKGRDGKWLAVVPTGPVAPPAG